MKPRIVVDARFVGPVPHGFARYVSRMAEGLAHLREGGSLPYELIFLRGRATPPEVLREFGSVEVGARFLSPLEWVEIPAILRKLGAALYHSPTFSSLPRSPCPHVVTIHDLNHLTYGSWKERLYYEKLLRRFSHGARAVMTVSEFSRVEIARWLGLPETQIAVVRNALEPRFLYPVSDQVADPVLARLGLQAGVSFFACPIPNPTRMWARWLKLIERIAHGLKI